MAELVRRERLEWPGIARRFFDMDKDVEISISDGRRRNRCKATHHDGVLTVRVPVPEHNATPAKIPVTRS